MVFFLTNFFRFILRVLCFPPPERFIKNEKSIPDMSGTKYGFFIAI